MIRARAEGRITETLVATESREKAAGRERTVPSTSILCGLFFLSGIPALLYQLVWQRALFRIFGVNIESVTVVVTAFMLGLGLGSLAGGWLSKRAGIPLLPIFALIEGGTGIFGLFSLRIFDFVGAGAVGMPLPVTAAVALGLVIVPTLLMGATLPLLVGYLAVRSGNVGKSVGLLYYVNTLGAAAACFAAAILLFPYLGMQRTIYIAVALNGVIALAALVGHFFDRRSVANAPEPFMSATANIPAMRFAPVLALAWLAGFVSLSYEIFFVRTISYASGSSAPAFALTLGAFLAGLASGARQAGRISSATPEAAVKRVVRSLSVANFAGFLFLPLLGYAAQKLGLAVVGVALFLVYVLAKSWGILLPCLSHLGIRADGRAGMRTGLLYLVNILGSATGSILTGFVLMDHIGLVRISSLLVIAGVTCATLLAIALPMERGAKLTRIGWAAATACLALLLTPRLGANVLENLMWKGAPDASPFAEIVENRSGIIAVDRAETVYGNGMYDGRFHTDLVHDTNGIIRPYALSLFHPAPRDVLMIGLSSGSWAQVIASNPEVASLTVIEINPGYLRLIAQVPEVASILSNPRVKIVIDDGRRWLRLNPERRFDAVVSNTTWNFRDHTTNLLSTEFLGIIKRHLKPGGIFFYNTTDSGRVQRTGCLAYPYGARFTNHMVVSMRPIAWDFERWRRTLEAYRIDGHPVLDTAKPEDRARLQELMGLRPQATAAGPSEERAIESCSGILARTASEEPVTDDNMGTEWQRFRLDLTGKSNR